MKTITQLKQVGQSEKYKLYADDEFEFLAALEVLYKNNIRQGMQASDELLNKVKVESDKLIAFASALELTNRSLKTKKQIREYLYKKGYNKTVQDYAVDKLEGYGYLNDLDYAKTYVQQQSKTKGINLIKKHLFEKGVSSNIIDEATEGLDTNQAILLVAKKYTRNKEKTQENKQRLYRHLISRGFTYGQASTAVSKLFEGESDDWN